MTKVKAITIADNEEFLRQVSVPVDLDDEYLYRDISILEEFCMEHEVMSMAAIQLGIPKRIVYLKNTINKMQSNSETSEERDYNEARILINPVIVSKKGLTDYWESCASCLDNIGHVRRPYMIVVEYLDIFGNVYRDNFEGFEATVLSHEMDHLDGILHIDIADQVLQMNRDDRKIFRQTHGYNIISQKGDYDKLMKDVKPLMKIKI